MRRLAYGAIAALALGACADEVTVFGNCPDNGCVDAGAGGGGATTTTTNVVTSTVQGTGGQAALPNGAPCGNASQCASGYCVDGVCCDTICDSLCAVCSVADGAPVNGTCWKPGAMDDADGDGFTGNEGDCIDCDPYVNPGAFEIANNNVDDDCNGMIDEPTALCDASLALNDPSGGTAAKAIDLCQNTTWSAKTYGVLDAKYVRANGTAYAPSANVGIQNGWGPNVTPQAGQRMLVLSSGHARTPSQPSACNGFSCSVSGPGTPPPGFPASVPNCAGASNINDDVGFEVTVRAPTNAAGYSFDFDFYSFEFPEWVCTQYNDQFVALVSQPPPGSINGNLCFDNQGNPVSVNIGFIDVCTYNPGYPQFPCALGPSELLDTGFNNEWSEDAGATSWLRTTAPVSGGQEFNIRFAIWDAGDYAWDSTVLIDNFQWLPVGTSAVVLTARPQ